MCGIVGIYNSTDEKLLKSMANAIEHRGPDGDGFFMGAKGGIGSRRLAIIDVAHGQMPISNEDNTKWIVYNGEIYNFQKLTEELKSKGHVFKTSGDTEMILHAYEEWGYDCVKRFDGMFAFAIYDTKTDEVFVARDQFGIKPFYYYQDGPVFIFGSEIKSFLKYPNFHISPNEKSIYKYLAYRKHDNEKDTFFENVYRLMPGEYGVFKKDKTEFLITKYYDLQLTTKQIKKTDAIKKFRELFVQSINDRLISEVPVGTCLSGGLDSSAVVCVINDLLKKNTLVKEKEKMLGKNQKTFSAVFPEQINNEEEYINAVLDHTQTEKNFIYPSSAGLFDEIEKFVYHQEEPFISSGPYAQWCVMREAHNKVKVLLDGQGSDEMMAGYTPYFFVYFKQLLKEHKYFTFIKEFIFTYPQIKGILTNSLKEKFKKKNLTPKDLINKDFLSKTKYHARPTISNNLKQRLKQDLFEESIPALLRYEDKNSMAFSIEGRVPFLSLPLVEFVFSLPESLIIKNGVNKYILRESLKDLLPEKVSKRKWKVGFTTPEVGWFREQKSRVYAIIDSNSFQSRPYFDHTKVKKYVDDFYAGKHDESMVIWRLINLEIWLRVFIDKK